jgi:hypothetical protein
VQAYMWADLAEARLSSSPVVAYDANGLLQSIAADMTPAEIAEAQRLARAWTPKPGAANPARVLTAGVGDLTLGRCQ